MNNKKGAEKSIKKKLLICEEKIRNLLAIVVVFGFVLIIGVLAILSPIFGVGDPDIMTDYIKNVASVYSGIVGFIIGYYFSKGK